MGNYVNTEKNGWGKSVVKHLLCWALANVQKIRYTCGSVPSVTLIRFTSSSEIRTMLSPASFNLIARRIQSLHYANFSHFLGLVRPHSLATIHVLLLLNSKYYARKMVMSQTPNAHLFCGNIKKSAYNFG